MEDSLNSGAVMFSKDGKYIYVRDSRNSNAGKLVKYNLETAATEVVIEDPNYDVSDVMVHPDTYEIQMVSFVKARVENVIFDESIREDIEVISKLNPGDYIIYDRDNADKTWLVGFTNDNTPVAFYAYDREKKEGTFLFFSKPDLANYQLAKMEPISFVSRDGLTIHGYLTMPVGQENQAVPMVLNVHGGPWHRDSWGYNPEAQWLANRGYACLQINFRGSTGYGKNFLNAGDREWSQKMHDDLIDGVNYITSLGYADPKRVAIYGVSYGGYAALVGATFTPDFFCCAIDVVGPSNLITMIDNIPPYWKIFLDNLKKRVGDPETEKEFLESCSPLFKVENIKIPIMIVQGANDPRVNMQESEQIVKAMRDKNIYHEYLLFHDEGHGISKPYNREVLYKQAEKFLAKYLGGFVEDDSLEILNQSSKVSNSIFD
ncbi:S9 family peptidase [bacterium]|nr:MAG: S9 family peptidase [bacterium]